MFHVSYLPIFSLDMINDIAQAGIPLVTLSDLSGAYEGLVRLQTVYDLDKVKMLHGLVAGERSGSLTREDAYGLGVASKDIGLRKTALDWFAVALAREAGEDRPNRDLYQAVRVEEFKIYKEVFILFLSHIQISK